MRTETKTYTPKSPFSFPPFLSRQVRFSRDPMSRSIVLIDLGIYSWIFFPGIFLLFSDLHI